MSLNDTPLGERIHIGIFGRRNAGKSSIMNALTGQEMSVVSDTLGTTTDPVSKAMELLPLGPVVFTDTPGLDDEGELGKKRVDKASDVLRRCHIVLIVVECTKKNSDDFMFFSDYEKNVIRELVNAKIPYIICVNKIDAFISSNDNLSADTIKTFEEKVLSKDNERFINKDSLCFVSAKTGYGIDELKNKIAALNPGINNRKLVSDLVSRGEIAVLVVPIDEAAPKGRLILPQQQVIRDLLETGAIPVVTKDTELEITLSKLCEKPKVVITDSQAFSYVSKIVPEDVLLTSFSILMARYKGDLEWQYEGAKVIDTLCDGDKILISEGCTHKRQCGDIGTVKLPALLKKYTNKELDLSFTSGGEFPKDLSGYKLIIHCGGCTLNDKEMGYRINKAKESNVSMTNYGMAISFMNGILDRSLKIFKTN